MLLSSVISTSSISSVSLFGDSPCDAEEPFGLVPVTVWGARIGSTGTAGGSCLSGLGWEDGGGVLPACCWFGLRTGEPGPEGDPVTLLDLLALLASCSALVLKADSGLLFLISRDCSSRKGFLGVE